MMGIRRSGNSRARDQLSQQQRDGDSADRARASEQSVRIIMPSDREFWPEQEHRRGRERQRGQEARHGQRARDVSQPASDELTRLDLPPWPEQDDLSKRSNWRQPEQLSARSASSRWRGNPERPATSGPIPIAIIGLACRYPDADDAAEFFQVFSTGRRTFRRIPPGRVDLADYYSSNTGTPDATYSTRAGLLEGWRFDRAAFGISQAAYHSADPAHWLALETAARALAGAGFPGGAGLPSERTGAFIGNTLTGDLSRAAALRLRWPYARQVLADALFTAQAPADLAERVLAAAAIRYLRPFPPVTGETLAGSAPGTIAALVCSQLGLTGGGFALDGGAASGLAAIASACSALASGDLDAAVAGGVDVSLDPLDLVGLAKAGVLATGDVRIYDENPTGFLPAEGCGMVLLMRADDARVADLPVYAEILGWGLASAGPAHRTPTDQAAMLLAMRKAYQRAELDPGDVQYLEGCGTGVGPADEAELAALATLRQSARQQAVLGAVTANIGYARAAAGPAGLIKTVLAAANGVLPPATGINVPHRLLRGGDARLRTPDAPVPWPDGPRQAAVSASSAGGLHVHVVLRRAVSASGRGAGPGLGESASTARHSRASTATVRPAMAHEPATFLLQAPDRSTLTTILARVADIAPWLSDSQLTDLACQFAIEAGDQGKARVAIVATRQEQLARLANEAITMLPKLTGGLVSTRPGIFAADDADGHVTMLLSSQPQHQDETTARQFDRALAVVRRLDELGVQPNVVVSHGIGELAGLVWAGCLSPASAAELNALRTAALAVQEQAKPGSLRAAMDSYATFVFAAPRTRLVSGAIGAEATTVEDIRRLLAAELLDARSATAETDSRSPAQQRLVEAVGAGVAGASLLVQSAKDRDLTRAIGQHERGQGGAGQRRKVPVISIDGDPFDDRAIARAAAALFAAGALTRPEELYPSRPARPIDIWREQIFITHPCQAHQPAPAAASLQPPSRPAPAQPASARPAPAQPAPAQAAPAQPPAAPPQSMVSAPVTSLAPWSRCYVEQTRPLTGATSAPQPGPWRVHTGGCEPFRPELEKVFEHQPRAGRTLAVLGDLTHAATIEQAAAAAQSAISTGRLLAISPDAGLLGFWASLHAEHPELAIVAVKAQLTPAALTAASQVDPVPGQHRELAMAADGTLAELVMVPAEPQRAGDFPLGPGDVVLISRSSGPAGAALAQVLACSGASVAVIGREDAEPEDAITSTLEELREAGAAVSYQSADPASATSLRAAVGRIESGLGRITAVAHAVSATEPQAISSLRPASLPAEVTSQAQVLEQLVTAVRTQDGDSTERAAQLKLIITFGSVTGRYGLATASTLVLASGVLAALGERLAAAGPGCPAVHVAWPAWTGVAGAERADFSNLTERAGYAPMPIAAGSRHLLKLLGADGRPARVSVHGRVGEQAPRPIQLTGPAKVAGRFAERVLVYYPGIELTTEANLSLATDPYLTQYQIDGVSLLPPMLAVEAMAQVASALTGGPLRTASDVRMTAPIVAPDPAAATVLRITAQRDDDQVSVVIRSDSTGYAVDHFQATFDCQAGDRQSAGVALPAVTSQPAAAVVPAAELYGTVCFQSGQFQVLSSVKLTGAHQGSGLATLAGPAWFASYPDDQLLLGDAAGADAALQVVQACMPHRRLLFAGCDIAEFVAGPPAGQVTIGVQEADQVTSAPVKGQVPTAAPITVPRQRSAEGAGAPALAGAADTYWNVEATDSAGRLVLRLLRLRMRDAGTLAQSGPWPLSLAGCLLERGGTELGLRAGFQARIAPAGQLPAELIKQGWVRAATTDAALADLVLLVRAPGSVAASWRIAEPGGRPESGRSASKVRPWLALIEGAGLGWPDENAVSGAAWALAQAVASCAVAMPPAGTVAEVCPVAGASWLTIRAGQSCIVGLLLDLEAVGQPIAVALMSGELGSAEPKQRTRRVAEPAAARQARLTIG
jgi:enediyne polyketide synthase